MLLRFAMAVDHIRYDLLAQEALREGVVRRVLTDAARNGLPGDHHFFVTFDTRTPGVSMSARLLAQYPLELTIVLQHQFWDLAVTEEGFEVGLSFNGIPERLTVPFRAIRGFFDPSVEFGMKFEMDPPDTDAAADATAASAGFSPPVGAPGTGTTRLPAASLGIAPAVAEVPEVGPGAGSGAQGQDEPAPDGGAPSQGGEVVRLDRFRKK